MISFTLSAAIQKLIQLKRRFLLLPHMRAYFFQTFNTCMLCILMHSAAHPHSNSVINLLVAAAIQKFTQFNFWFFLLLHLRSCFCQHFIANMWWILHLKVSKWLSNVTRLLFVNFEPFWRVLTKSSATEVPSIFRALMAVVICYGEWPSRRRRKKAWP